jgi:hypothetical protein
MDSSTRRKIGVIVVGISFLAALCLWLFGMPLLSDVSSQKLSGNSVLPTVIVFQVHWPLLAVGAGVVVGLLVTVWPQRLPPRLGDGSGGHIVSR